MATAIKKCRVCGRSYEYCHTVRRVAGVFRWQDVACSPKCGASYLAQIEASRAGSPVKSNIADQDIVATTSEADSYDDYDEDADDEDDWFADDFEDEAEEIATE